MIRMKANRKMRLVLSLLLLGSSGLVFQAANCVSFVSDSTLAATNICFIVDCTNGFFGGLVQPCGSPLTSLDDLLADCPAPVIINVGNGN